MSVVWHAFNRVDMTGIINYYHRYRYRTIERLTMRHQSQILIFLWLSHSQISDRDQITDTFIITHNYCIGCRLI
jgi:hypothetical protein